MYAQNFSETAFTKAPLFYSAFLALYHMNYPLTMFNAESTSCSEKDLAKIKTALDEINVIVMEPNSLNKEEEEFILTLKKNTTTPDVRMRRSIFIINKLNTSLR